MWMSFWVGEKRSEGVWGVWGVFKGEGSTETASSPVGDGVGEFCVGFAADGGRGVDEGFVVGAVGDFFAVVTSCLDGLGCYGWKGRGVLRQRLAPVPSFKRIWIRVVVGI
jgi:hypothetical protein